MGKFWFEFLYSRHRTMDCSIYANSKPVLIRKSLIITSWMIRVTDGFTNWDIFHYPKITFLSSWKRRQFYEREWKRFSMQFIFIIQIWIPKPWHKVISFVLHYGINFCEDLFSRTSGTAIFVKIIPRKKTLKLAHSRK